MASGLRTTTPPPVQSLPAGSTTRSSVSSSSSFEAACRRFACSSFSVAVATGATNPIDVVKTNLQMATTSAAGRASSQSLTFIGTASTMYSAEGGKAFFRGMSSALMRSVVYGGVRIGCYAPLKTLFAERRANTAEKGKTPLVEMIAAGASAGAVATVVSNPLDLVKTRQQFSAATGGPAPAMSVMRDVLAREGVLGLWKGTAPAATRAAVLTASQCATYDSIKQFLLTGIRPATASVASSFGFDGAYIDNMGDGFKTHFTASMVTGIVSTTLTNPVDVVKTRMFCSKGGQSLASVIGDVWTKEGVMGFMRGWVANYTRLGPQTLLIFVVFENVKGFFGVKNL